MENRKMWGGKKKKTTYSSKLSLNCLRLSKHLKTQSVGDSLAVQWLGLRAFTDKSLGSIPGWGTKISQDTRCGQKKKKVSTVNISGLKDMRKF